MILSDIIRYQFIKKDSHVSRKTKQWDEVYEQNYFN